MSPRLVNSQKKCGVVLWAEKIDKKRWGREVNAEKSRGVVRTGGREEVFQVSWRRVYTRGKRRVPTFCTAQSGERDPYLYEEGRGGWKSTLLTIAPMSAWGARS